MNEVFKPNIQELRRTDAGVGSGGDCGVQNADGKRWWNGRKWVLGENQDLIRTLLIRKSLRVKSALSIYSA